MLHPFLRYFSPLQNLALPIGYIFILSFHQLMVYTGAVFSLGVPAKLVCEFSMAAIYPSHISYLI